MKMSSSEPMDEDSPPSAQRRDFIPDTQEDLRYDTEADSLSSSDTSDHEDDDDTDDGDLSDPPDPERPNRIDGATFSSRFAEERDVSKSLEGMRARDLAVHLYNSFQLHERAKRLRMHTTEKIWEPPRKWTAWPMPAEYVPREREEEPYTETHSSTLCGWPNASSRQVLEEHLIAAASKRARDHFARRPSASGSENSAPSTHAEEGNDSGVDDAILASYKPQTWKAELTTQAHTRPLTRDTADLREELDSQTDAQAELSSASQPEDSKKSRERDPDVKTRRKKRNQDSSNNTSADTNRSKATFFVEDAELYPGPLTDSDQITALLTRPARHTLSMFDKLLAAMHHSRASHLRRLGGFSNARLKAPPVSYSNATAQSIVEAAKLAQRFNVKQTIDSFKPWDWSNILGFAAIAGFDAEVVQRTRARCERLFGQRMDFIPAAGKTEEVATGADPQTTAVDSAQDTAMAGAETNTNRQAVTAAAEEADATTSADEYEPSSRHDTLTPSRSTEGNVRVRKLRELELEDGLHVDGFLRPMKRNFRWQQKGFSAKVEVPHWWRETPPVELPGSETESEPPLRPDLESESEPEPEPEAGTTMAPDIAMSDYAAQDVIDPELLAIDPELLDPSLNMPAPAPAPATASSSQMQPETEQEQEHPGTSDQPAPSSRTKKAKEPKAKKPKKRPAPKQFKRLRQTKYPRLPEELEMWRKRGFVLEGDEPT